MVEPAVHVLVVDDDDELRNSLLDALRSNGYRATGADDGPAGLAALASERTDLVLLDIILPSLDGFSVCRQIRATSLSIPILMLSHRAEVHRRVEGLDAGANDFLVKPFALEELLARVRALLRASSVGPGPRMLYLGDVTIDRWERRAWRGERALSLTQLEYRLLEVLMVNADRPTSREELHRLVWGINYPTASRALDAHVANLREKLELPGERRLLQTVRGVGFTMVP